MHELGVVFKVIQQVEEIAAENDVTRVEAVTLQLGEVSAVIPEYLTDCWKWAVKRTEVIRDARLEIETDPRRDPLRRMRQGLRNRGPRQNLPILRQRRDLAEAGKRVHHQADRSGMKQARRRQCGPLCGASRKVVTMRLSYRIPCR